jgi:ribonuclease E
MASQDDRFPDTDQGEVTSSSRSGDSTPPAAPRRRAATRVRKKPKEADRGEAKPQSDSLATPDEPEMPEAAEAAAVLPSVDLVFQAPQPTVARRRRASTAAASKQPGADGEDESPEAMVKASTDGADGAATSSTSAETEAGEDGEQDGGPRRSRRRGGRGRRSRSGRDDALEPEVSAASVPQSGGDDAAGSEPDEGGTDGSDAGEPPGEAEDGEVSSRRRRRRRRSGSTAVDAEDPPGTVTKVREPRKEREEPAGVKGSTRLEAKKQRRREGREAGRRRTVITEAEFLARRESVERVMVVRHVDGRTQIGVVEDEVLVEHYVSRETNASMAGNVYLGRVQNVLPSMEAAFVDIGKGRNAVLYAGEVNWDVAGLDVNQPKRIENALKSGDSVVVQVTKDPMGHKGARLTSQISLPGRYLVYVPEGSMTGISRKLPDTERTRLKGILKDVVPDTAGVIVRTAAEGASEEELRADVERLTQAWERIKDKAEAKSGKKGSAGGAPVLLHGEPDLTVRVIRDVFNEDFTSLVVAGEGAWREISGYVDDVAPDLGKKLRKWTAEEDVFAHYRIDEQLAKAMDRKVWLPSGGSLVIDRTEAMTVVDVNTGKFVGSGGNLEETVTKNNLEAAEEIVRQLRLRDIGGIIVIDFIDMVLESNRDLVVRRLLECLGRDRTKHQVAEVTSLGLVQMTRKRVGSGLIEVFSEVCEHCNGRGIIVSSEPVDRPNGDALGGDGGSRSRGRRGKAGAAEPVGTAKATGPTPAQIAAAAHAAAIKGLAVAAQDEQPAKSTGAEEPDGDVLAGQLASAEDTDQASDRIALDEPPVDEPPVDEPASAEVSQEEVSQEGVSQEEVSQEEPPQESEGAHVLVDLPLSPESAATPPRRRRRGRVVAPAGPPRPTAPDVGSLLDPSSAALASEAVPSSWSEAPADS